MDIYELLNQVDGYGVVVTDIEEAALEYNERYDTDYLETDDPDDWINVLRELDGYGLTITRLSEIYDAF